MIDPNRKPEPDDDAYDGPHGQIYDDDDNPTDLSEMDTGLGIFGEIYGDEYGGE